MRKTVFFVIFLTIALGVKAQYVFEKDDIMYNVGIAIPDAFGLVPSINFSGEFGAIPTGDVGIISFGGVVAYQIASLSYYVPGANGNYTFHRFYFGPRAIWHLHTFTSNKYDLYAGLGVGIQIHSGYNNYWGERIASSAFLSGESFIGGRYIFKPNLSFFAEAGYGALAVLKFGLTFKM